MSVFFSQHSLIASIHVLYDGALQIQTDLDLVEWIPAVLFCLCVFDDARDFHTVLSCTLLVWF